MNIEAKGLRTTIYKVPNLDEAKGWYSKAFGTSPYFDEPFYVGFDIGGYELGLLPTETIDIESSNVLSYWAVNDITDAFDKMISNGATELEVPTDVGDGIKVALVRDPWKNVIGLIFNPYFKEKHAEKTVIEWAQFELQDADSEKKLLELSGKLEREFLLKQNGFIKRELLRKTAKEWVDLIYWESEKHAKQAFENSASSDVCGQYFELMVPVENMESIVSHYELMRY